MALGLPPEVATWLLAQGPAGVIISLLLYVIVYLFKRYEEQRDLRTADAVASAAKFAELGYNSAKIIEKANQTTESVIAAVGTLKLLTELRQREGTK